MRFHILDTETVGLKPFDHGGGVCEISVREVDADMNPIAHHYSLIDPEGPISAGASGVHGIRDADVEDAPTMPEWLTIVLESNIWCEDQQPFYFIAHNSTFDHNFLAPYLSCKYQLVDTLMLARRYYPDAENHKLTTLAVLFDLDGFSALDAHGAGQDTLVLEAFVRQLMLDTGLTLPELCVDAQRKEPITKFAFGKHKGKLIETVAKSDRGYIEWCLKNMESLKPDMRETLEAALA